MHSFSNSNSLEILYSYSIHSFTHTLCYDQFWFLSPISLAFFYCILISRGYHQHNTPNRMAQKVGEIARQSSAALTSLSASFSSLSSIDIKLKTVFFSDNITTLHARMELHFWLLWGSCLHLNECILCIKQPFFYFFPCKFTLYGECIIFSK